jgi:SAM-dependent methyltransferase
VDWDSRFAGEEYLFGIEPADALKRYVPMLVDAGRTLVVADGEGRNSTFLAEHGFDVVAQDYSRVAVAKAQKLAEQKSVEIEFRVSDIHDFDWTAEPYDNVVAIFIQFVTPDRRAQIFEGLKSALAPGGTLFIHGYTPEQIDFGTGGPPNADHMYSGPMLDEAFHDLDILVNRSYHAEISEGKGHYGMSALIDFVAKAPHRQVPLA